VSEPGSFAGRCDPKESTSFLKKGSKKPVYLSAAASPDRLGPESQKFFGSFFQKSTSLPSSRRRFQASAKADGRRPDPCVSARQAG
jgi:hypothetical protein